MEHELWLTAPLNKLLAGLLTPLLTTIGVPPDDPSQPIPNYIAMEVLVIVVILTGALLLRGRLSVENPGKFQHLMEVVVEFVQGLAEELIGHDSRRYVALLAALGLFILPSCQLGFTPPLESPTGHIQVTLGCAV